MKLKESIKTFVYDDTPMTLNDKLFFYGLVPCVAIYFILNLFA